MATRSFLSLLVLFAGAIALTALAATGRLVPGESSVARSLQDAPLGAAIEEVADVLASPFVEYTLVGVMAIWAWRLRQHALAAAALLALAGMALNPAIKELIQRDRPTDADVMIREHAGGFGFPSGHVQSATIVYGYAAFVAWRLAPRVAASVVIVAAVLAVMAIAFDRVYNGAHWPSDVAGGALIGLLLIVAAVRLPGWLAPRARGATRGSPRRRDFG